MFVRQKLRVALVTEVRAVEQSRAEIAEAHEQLTVQAEELRRSNRDLEQFAYVASHDLQEPLRAVGSYAQLLAERYQEQLDERAQRYLRYMVQGADRMRTLIDDVLRLSRVGSRGQQFAPVALDEVLDEVLLGLQRTIEETGAVIVRSPLPVVQGDAAQCGQLLQNLIANALKFRRPTSAPRVEVTAAQAGDEWVIAVRDNGIGIDPRHHERVFAIFRRLHTQEEYPGTGIGLAICRKVVERHGGRIWVDAAPADGGSVFRFTFPITGA